MLSTETFMLLNLLHQLPHSFVACSCVRKVIHKRHDMVSNVVV